MIKLILAVIFTSSIFASYEVEFSTAGFFQVDPKIREAANFNPGWRYFKGAQTGAEKPDFDDSKWQVVNLPHGLELLPLSASGGVNYQGEAWYRKHFTLDEKFLNKKLFLHFEGIMGKSKIFVNGKLAKAHFGGFLPAHIDVTKLLKPGKNIIAVWCDNSNDPDYPPGKPQEHLDFSYFGGIYRDVFFIAHNEVYITNANATNIVAGGGIFVHFQNFSKEFVNVVSKININNDSSQLQNLTIEAALKLRTDENNSPITNSLSRSIEKNSNSSCEVTIPVKNPKLWTPDSPTLYDLIITIKNAKEQIVDTLRLRIGIRQIEFKGKEGFFLNGEHYQEKLMGANRHQDFAIIGNALPNKTHWRDAVKLREAGLKLIRNAHYPQDPAFMDACDELGLFVIVNTPGWQFWNAKPIFRQRVVSDVRNMVRRDRNHPSVIMWEPILNETWYPDDFAKEVHETVHQEFPYPGCYTACDHEARGQQYFDIVFSHPLNMHIFANKVANTMENFKKYQFDYSKENRPVYNREWGDCVDNWNSHNSPSRVDREWGENAQLIQVKHYSNPNYLYTSYNTIHQAPAQFFGGSLWHSFDHQRGYHPDPFFGGIMNSYRQPKYSYYMFKSQMKADTKIPNIETGPFTYVAHEMSPFSPKDITVFSNCDEVRLTVNGKLIGTKSTKTHAMPRIPVTFEDAFDFMDVKQLHRSRKANDVSILAEGIINGEVVTKTIRRPSLRRNKILLKADFCNTSLTADGSDIVVVVAYLVDDEGLVKRLSNEFIRFTVEGEGTLITQNDLQINPQKAVWGEAVALVRSTNKPGKIKISAEVLKKGINQPRSSFIEITSVAPAISAIYSELPLNNIQKSEKNNIQQQSEELIKIKNELDKVKSELNSFKLKQVEKQQEEFESPK